MGTVGLNVLRRILAHRGRGAEAADLVDRYLPTARQIGDLQILSPALITAAVSAWVEATRRDRARTSLREFDDATRDGPTEYRELQLPGGGTHLSASRRRRARGGVAGADPSRMRTRNAMTTVHAVLAEMRGDRRARRGDVGRRRPPGARGAIRSSARTRSTAWHDACRRSREHPTPNAPGRRRARSSPSSASPSRRDRGSGPCCSPMSSPRQRPSRPRVRDWRRSMPSRSA